MTRRGKLKQFAESVEPGVVVVEPWILRRIIRLDGRVLGFGKLLSRRETYPIERNRLLALVDSRELGLTSPGSMPERLVVLAEPDDMDSADTNGADGLVHLSEISWDRIQHPSEVLKVGQEVKVKVISIDRDRRTW